MAKTLAMGEMPDIKFNLEAQDKFALGRGVVFEHWAAIPSPIGKKDRGEYRRPDSLDTISENGYIYKKVGEFVGTLVSNASQNRHEEGGIIDSSSARIVIPRFYNKHCSGSKEEIIALLPGDRVYAKDIELFVDNYQEVQYSATEKDYLQYPVKKVTHLIDSRGIEYKQNKDFSIDSDGNLCWSGTGKNPGIDPETGRGRIYGVRYTYLAFWYVDQLINEIRITNTNTPEDAARMPYHVTLQREYIYHNKNRGDKQNEVQKKTKEQEKRTVQEPEDNIHPQSEQFKVKVNVKDFTE